jgi:hypothetical protein
MASPRFDHGACVSLSNYWIEPDLRFGTDISIEARRDLIRSDPASRQRQPSGAGLPRAQARLSGEAHQKLSSAAYFLSLPT